MTEVAPLTDRLLAGFAAQAYTTSTFQSGDVSATGFFWGEFDVIAFRGTQPDKIADWVRDLDIWPTWRRGLGMCHRGFVTGAESVLSDILHSFEGGRLVITGHSLGGALALAFAGLLVRSSHPVEAVVTFGSPRLGFGRLQRLLSKTTVRQYVDGNDLVPEVPRPYLHMRTPIAVGTPLPDPFDAHAVARYAALVPETVIG